MKRVSVFTGLVLGMGLFHGVQALAGGEWTPYMPVDAVKEALSEPLKFVAKEKSPSLMNTESCLWQNSKVSVIREYCSFGQYSEKGDVAGIVIIPHDNRGMVRLYTEPSSGKRTPGDGSLWHVYSFDKVLNKKGQPAFSKKQKFKSILAEVDRAKKSNSEATAVCYAGAKMLYRAGETQEEANAPSEGCYDPKVHKFDSATWTGELKNFFEANHDDWMKLLKAVKADKLPANVKEKLAKDKKKDEKAKKAAAKKKPAKKTTHKPTKKKTPQKVIDENCPDCDAKKK